DDADTVLTKFSPAIMSAVCPRPGATPDDGPDCLFNDERDLFYLRLVFALVRNPIWHPHLFADHHIDRCTSIIAECCQLSPRRQIYNIVGVLLRTTPEQVPMLLLESITEEQWWGMIRRAWTEIYRYGEVKDAEELLPVLVEGTKKYMHIAYTPDLQRLSEDVDRVSSIAEERALECIDDVKGLVTVVRDMLAQKFSQ
ncbi:hypothetical protein DEU56DRAFT_811085, partial [Suillus clintonianus]|uniref:uncharacterized protein n=1 Tax=Suillus clintonianus TaxID=1904413 RepID=UPI001B85CE50